MKLNTADDVIEEMTGAIGDDDLSTLGDILNTLIQDGRCQDLVTALESFYLDPVEVLPGIGRLPGVETTEPLEDYLEDYERLWTSKNARLFI